VTARVGQTLRDARKERGIDLSEVERATKIRVKFLEAIEEERWEDLPGPAYTRGFVSSYARFLELDEAELVDRYRASAGMADRSEPLPTQVIRRGTLTGRHRGPRGPAVLLVAGLVAAVALGLAIAAAIGGSGNGGDGRDHGKEKASRAKTTGGAAGPSGARAGQPPSTPRTEVSVELRSTGLVWVCLVDDRGRALVNETLSAEEVRGPYTSPAFAMTLGNGSLAMTVDGQPVDVPDLAEPLGYRVTPDGVRELDSSARPTCA
jgi:cytoskeleton protein RodZ